MSGKTRSGNRFSRDSTRKDDRRQSVGEQFQVGQMTGKGVSLQDAIALQPVTAESRGAVHRRELFVKRMGAKFENLKSRSAEAEGVGVMTPTILPRQGLQPLGHAWPPGRNNF